MALVYGIHAVEEALKAGSPKIERVCIERGQRNPRIQQIISLAREKHVPFSFEEKPWLDRKSEGERHQGVLCYTAEMPTLEIEDVILQASTPGLIVVLDGVEDPHNLGAIMRSAEVSGADGLVLPSRRSAGLSATAVKSSAGAATHLKVARSGNIANCLEMLKRNRYWIIGLAGESKTPVWEVDFKLPTALVLGNEGSGLHRLVKDRCDLLASIPVRGRIDSHNVSVAAGIALYEALRQRA
jgi:23S rRNA (guanosine2251-2'-O)-methyltransferase